MKLTQYITSWSLTAICLGGAYAYNFKRPFHHGVNALLAAAHIPGAKLRAGPMLRNPFGDVPAKAEGNIAGYRISRGYGMQTHPIHGDHRMHHGVDVATPVGTPVYAPADASVGASARVSCHNDTVSGAGLIAVVNSDLTPDKTLKLFHLSDCYPGVKKQGEVIALSGDTGDSTGPHLHGEIADRLGRRSEPTVGIFSWLLTGKPPTSIDTVAHSVVSVREMSEWVGRDLSPRMPTPAQSSLFEKISDEDLFCSIGGAEGTVEVETCNKTKDYESHTDPGNKVKNRGAFSYQHGAQSAAEADRKQTAKLRHVEKIIRKRAAEAGVTFGKFEMLTILDSFNQSESAALGKGGALDRRIAAKIAEERAQSFVDPTTGKLDAPGLGSNIEEVRADQLRRVEAIAESMYNRQN